MSEQPPEQTKPHVLNYRVQRGPMPFGRLMFYILIVSIVVNAMWFGGSEGIAWWQRYRGHQDFLAFESKYLSSTLPADTIIYSNDRAVMDKLDGQPSYEILKPQMLREVPAIRLVCQPDADTVFATTGKNRQVPRCFLAIAETEKSGDGCRLLFGEISHGRGGPSGDELFVTMNLYRYFVWSDTLLSDVPVKGPSIFHVNACLIQTKPNERLTIFAPRMDAKDDHVIHLPYELDDKRAELTFKVELRGNCPHMTQTSNSGPARTPFKETELSMPSIPWMHGGMVTPATTSATSTPQGAETP